MLVSLPRSPEEERCSSRRVSSIVVFVVLMLVSVPLTVRLPPTVASPDRLKLPPVRAPEAVTLVRLISSSKATETPLEAAVVVTLEPPEIVRSSVASAMSSEPLSPSTVRVVTTDAVLVEVTRPLASTVMIGIAVAEPTVPAETPLLASVAVMVALAEPSKEAEPVASPAIASVLEVSRAVAVAALPVVS